MPPNILWNLWGRNTYSSFCDDDDDTVYCSECGEEYIDEDGYKICPYCGHIEDDYDFDADDDDADVW